MRDGLVRLTNLLLGQVVGQVGNHDLGLGRNAISGRTALTALSLGASLSLGSLDGVVSGDLVCNVLQR